MKKPPLATKEATVEQPMSDDTKKPKMTSAAVAATRPKNPSATVLPSDGYVLEIDGKFKSEYRTPDEAMKAGLELKKKYSFIQVIVYGAKERTRTVVALPGQEDEKTEVALT